MKILVVGADGPPEGAVITALARSGHTPVEVPSSSQAAVAKQLAVCQAVVLWSRGEGGEVLAKCQRLRRLHPSLPILVVSRSARIPERVALLDAGADDVVLWPEYQDEVVPRLRALLRRAQGNCVPVLRLGDLVIDTARRQVTRSGRVVPLTRREYTLLEALVRHAGRPLTRRFIQEAVWQDDSSISNNVDVCLCQLRRKLGVTRKDTVIRTIYGVGYMLQTPDGDGGDKYAP